MILRDYCTKTSMQIAQAVCTDGIFPDDHSGLLYAYKRTPGAKVLAVAHLDTVLPPAHFARDLQAKVVFSPVLDDRLGAWIIGEVLPKMGIKTDILFTTGEESCASTATDWVFDHEEKAREYNWIVEFDRAGGDWVTYGAYNAAAHKAMRKFGFSPQGQGSYSDIADLMPELGIWGVNIGCGYYGAHRFESYADLNVLNRQLLRFKEFYRACCDRRFPLEYPIGRKGKSSLYEFYDFGLEPEKNPRKWGDSFS